MEETEVVELVGDRNRRQSARVDGGSKEEEDERKREEEREGENEAGSEHGG